jgi:hypothetical protein
MLDSTRPSTAIDCQSVGIYTVVLLAFAVKVTESPRTTGALDAAGGAEGDRDDRPQPGARAQQPGHRHRPPAGIDMGGNVTLMRP